MNFSEEQILSMAPDESSKKSGKELANTSKWVKRDFSDRALWGECQGSGKLPYQTQIDLTSVAFKCSCPSRKFPCKHGLGLLLLFSRDKRVFTNSKEPDWVTDWLDKRSDREEKKSEKKVKERKADPGAQLKRQENRVKLVEDGMAELRLWLKDIIRNGILNIPEKDASYFENMARRMVDAKAPGLSVMVRYLRNINFYDEGWQTAFLDQLVRIYLVLEGFKRMESLEDNMKDELRSLVGFTQNQDELKEESGIRDDWFVLARRVYKEGNLTTERNWLYGLRSQKYALILQFYVKGQLSEVNLLPGSIVDAEINYFKGAHPMRALIKEQFAVKGHSSVIGFKNWEEVLTSASEAHAANPWISALPVVVEDVIPVRNANEWLLKDRNGNAIMVNRYFTQMWKLMSVSGGKPLRVFALGNENNFEPVGVWVNDQYTAL